MSRDLNHKTSNDTGRYLEAIIICVDYSDILAETLKYNRVYFDNLVIVTSHADRKTQNLCRKYNIEPVITNCFYEDGATFNKAAGINLGIAYLKYNDFVMHLDADVLLPVDFRNSLFMYPLRKDCIFGMDRQNIIGFEAYKDLIETRYFTNQYRDKFIMQMAPEENGARLVHREFGYVAIGYAQLFHMSYLKKYQMRYPQNQKNAERTDVLFSLQWPSENRILIPTVSVFHLESERCGQGTNWNGRVSAEFAPKK